MLSPGKLLRPLEIGLLAEVGRAVVSVIPSPQIAILATGNELVSLTEIPGPGQIRNSNEPLLAGLAQQAGGSAVPLGIACDDPADLERHVEAGLMRDVLVLSGGVSAGVLDLVPHVLAKLGVTQVFHKVNLKPGKPLWFGLKTRGEGRTTLVFGLPGNPVSSLVCFELFVRPAIQKLRGLPPEGLRRMTARRARPSAARRAADLLAGQIASRYRHAAGLARLGRSADADRRQLPGAVSRRRPPVSPGGTSRSSLVR